MIAVEHLVKRYGPVLAVDDASFRVDQGEVVGFLGPNGAGKSTTMKIVTGFIPATGGRCLVADHDVATDPLEVKRRIGYLPETCPLYADMRVVDYLGFVAEARGIPRASRARRVDEVVDRCGLRGYTRRTIGRLSKGYRQRTGLAQALIHDPDILILDEPTSGLDPHQIIEIRELIRAIGRTKTVILSTHILGEVQATCDRAIIIRAGRIVADSPLDQLADRSLGQAVFTAGLVAEGADALAERLERLPGVSGVRALDAPAGAELRRYELRASAAGDALAVPKAVFDLAVERGCKLVELQRPAASLEEVFIELTREPGGERP